MWFFFTPNGPFFEVLIPSNHLGVHNNTPTPQYSYNPLLLHPYTPKE